MAVIYVGERVGKRRGGTRHDGKKVIRTHARQFFVQSNSPDDTDVTIRQHPAIPRLGTPWAVGSDFDGTSLVRSVEARLLDRTKLYWEVDLEYSNEAPEEEEEKEDPADEPPDIEWGYETVQVVANVKRIEGSLGGGGGGFEGIVNSAGEPFDPPPLVDETILVLRISRNEAAFNPQLGEDFFGAVNNAPFAGREAGQAMLVGLGSKRQSKNGVTFDRVSYTFKFRRDGWQLVLLDHGTFFREGGEAVRFLDRAGNPITGNLDGAGGKLADGAGPVFLIFDVRPAANFGNLNLF